MTLFVQKKVVGYFCLSREKQMKQQMTEELINSQIQ